MGDSPVRPTTGHLPRLGMMVVLDHFANTTPNRLD